MATLVLSVVGGAIGGPVGAAIGAAIGRQADAAIFAPKGREGPRLADLKVQASTYGQQIPQLFGTMRVAGSVIWATDLIERRTKSGGGKGRPSVTNYSYAASLAIALSSRRVRAIRRIWADGNLLRGASGSFKERCTFRWYEGSEDQAADPLIASDVGLANASAFRGLAYAVFEELELASFGNRIPSLTFEVEADAGDVDAGMVGDALLGERGRCLGRWPFAGYAASGERAREALAPLFAADATRLVSAPEGWRLAPTSRAGDSAALAEYREAARGEATADRTERRRAPLAALPGTIRLRHYAPERDYQLGQQASIVAGGGAREEPIDLPAVLSAGAARALAQQLAAAAADGRETCVWQVDLAALALTVGARLRLSDGSLWRLAERRVRGDRVEIELSRHQPLVAGSATADAGTPVVAPDWPDGEGVVHVIDLPSIGSPAAEAPRLVVAGAGSNDGWRGADCWIRADAEDEPVALGTLRPAAALGALAAPLASASVGLFDGANAAIVALANPSMTLDTVSDAALLGGANRAMIGGELLQFGMAEPIGPALWRLTRLLRGRAGTAAAEGHEMGAPFVLLDDPALLAVPSGLAGWAAGGDARLQWAARNDTALTEVAIPRDARALRPLAPVHGRVTRDAAGGITIGWIRRTRLDTGWRDAIDVPIGESRERYRITPVPAAGPGPWETEAPTLYLDAVTLAALPAATSLDICQIGDFALSPPLVLALP